MLPVSRLGQPVGMVTATSPWLSVNCEPSPHWLWLTGWFQATPPLVFYPPAVWIPEYTHLVQWDRPSVKIIRLLPPPLSQSANLRHPHLSHPLPKILKRWMSPEEVSLFPRREKDHLTNQIIQIPGGRVPRTCHLCPSRLSGHVAAKPTTTETKTSPSLPLLHLPCPSASSPAEPSNFCSSGGASNKQAVLDVPVNKGVWPIFHINQHFREAWLQPMTSLDGKLSQLLKVLKDIRPSSGFSSRVTLLKDNTHKKQRMSKGKASYGGTLLLSTDKQTVCVSSDREDKEEEKKDKRPVASTPVPGSSWYVVWTGDDRVFFFNPTIHLSVWERPGDLIGRDISCIIKDPPHKRKKTISSHEDEDDKHVHKSKRSRAEEPASLLPQPQEVQLLPLELRVAHFREMMLERGVSAFSTWEKELHKMVFDPRYLLLTPDQRKQVFDQFVKSRIKDEYKEKKNKLQKAREDFRQLLEEVKITSRCTFKRFCARYRSDHRFNALNRKQEQEVLFNHYITTLRKRNKENRARLRKMR